MALLDRIMDRAEISRSSLTLNQYLQQLVEGRLGYGYTQPFVQYGVDGRPVERTPASFETYARDIYAAHPVIFGLMEARRSVFSEARFCWRAVKDGNPGDVLPISDGLELLNAPWPGAQSGTLISRMRQDADLGGTAFVVREQGRLRRLRPDWVTIVLSGNPWEDLRVDMLGIAYAPNGPDNSPVETYLADEVCLWAPIPDPLAQFRGMSWLTPVIREIDADNAATTHRKSTLEKGAWLGPIVSAPQGTTLEQFKKFVEAADSAHAGPNNAGRMVFLAPGSEIKTVAQSLRDLDMKAISGAAETRIAAASRVPAVIAQISEGLQGSSLNQGNYTAAKRQWIDGSLRPDWRSLCEALSVITPPPDLSGLDLPEGTTAQLWILESDIALLHEDRLEAAQVRSANATTINTLVTAGFVPDSIVQAVRDDDLSALKHSGAYSVQLQAPGANMGAPGAPAADADGDGQPDAQPPDQQGEQQYQAALEELRASRAALMDAADLLRAQVYDADGDVDRARVPRDGDGDGRHAAFKGGPDIVPNVPTVLDPEAFRRSVDPAVADRLSAGDPPREIAEDLQRRAGQFRRSAKSEDDEDRREFLLRVARDHDALADRVRAVADLPLKRRSGAGPGPRPVTGRLRGEADRPAPPPKVPPAKPPSRRMTPEEQRVADALAAGRFSERVAVELLTGRHEPEGLDPETARPFTTGMVHAGYITELAWTGDRDRLEAYLRSQNTSTLHAAAPFFGLSLPSDGGHEAAVAAFADRAMQLEAPRRELPSGEELRQSLMSRKVPDLKASLRAAGLPVSGRKADLVDRLVAAYGAVRGDGDDATDRPDRGAGPSRRRDGRGRGRGAARPLDADREPDAGATGPAAAGVGGGVGGVAPAKAAPAEKATPRKATARTTVSADWLPGSARPLSQLSAEQAARAAREGLVDKAAAAAHIRDQADEADAAAERLRRPDTGPLDRPTGRQRTVPFTERDRQDAAARREVEAARLRRLADRIEGAAAPAKATPRKAPAAPAKAAAPAQSAPGPAPDLTGSPRLSTDPAVRAVQVENRIREAYARAEKLPGGGVTLTDLRNELGEATSRTEIDEALRRMGRERGASLLPNENTKALTQADHDAAVQIGPVDYHYLEIQDPSLRPLPATAPAKRAPAKAAKRTGRRAQPEGLPPLVTRQEWEGWTAQQHRDYASARMKAAQDPDIQMSDALRESVRKDARQHFAIAASMRREELGSLSDGELRDRLEARGLSTEGSRAELLARLRG